MTQSLRDKVREETLREVQAALPADTIGNDDWNMGWNGYGEVARKYVTDMLPKPDRAAELVERWREREGGVFPEEEAGAESFARFLISEGIVL